MKKKNSTDIDEDDSNTWEHIEGHCDERERARLLPFASIIINKQTCTANAHLQCNTKVDTIEESESIVSVDCNTAEAIELLPCILFTTE